MKRSVFAGLTAMLILSTAVTAQAAHTHEYTKQNSKVYVCECGKEKPLYSLKGERVITLNCNGGSLYGKRRKGIVRHRVLFRYNALCTLELDRNTHSHLCRRGRLIH